jgi:HKD family nuclease
VDAKFVGQPFEDQDNLLDFIEHVLDTDATELFIVVAWAKQSGLLRVRSKIETFRGQGGYVHMIVGVSEGGATREGLALAMELSDDAHVFHDPRRTFHPKVYLGTGATQHSLFVGSSNLTAGGLGWNYESSLWLDSSGNLEGPFDEARRWIDQLLAEPTVCQPLTEDLVTEMMLSRDIFIATESAGRRLARRGSLGPEDTDSISSGSAGGIFGTPIAILRQLPRLLNPGKLSGARSKQPTKSVPPAPHNPVTPALASLGATFTRRWFKQMDNTAAQIPKQPGSSATGNLRLSQSGFPINHRTYFVKELFGGLPWTLRPDRASESEVEVPFNCTVDGVSLGQVDVRISHDPNRGADQNNVTTLLHWGPVLGPVLRANNFLNFFVTLERSALDEFYLTISPTPTGDFLA